ncbi:MAG: hypothetical protein VZR09_03970 [Candidatus Gastranaerophilaceae bacterium]|nr:hypothetical protein [Candidatus Gastranaerophilaceae bacterium]
MTVVGKLLEEFNRIEQELEKSPYIEYNNVMEYQPVKFKENKKKSVKSTYIKTSKQEKAILNSKILQGEYFMEGDYTATLRTENYLYIVELFNLSDIPEIQVLRKRKIK